MFTGLVEAVGTVVSIENLGEQARLSIQIPFADELKDGDSVAINGCCLTVTTSTETTACFDLLAQTLRVTSLNHLAEGSIVNLERAMMVGDRFGGHFVQGHVDATGSITDISVNGQDHIITIELPDSITKLCVDKGSISLDGISLTIAELTESKATFWITPHTWEHTNLKASKLGQTMNLEADMLAKHVAKLMQRK